MNLILEKMRELGYKDAKYDQFTGFDFTSLFTYGRLHFNGKLFCVRLAISYIRPELMNGVISELEILQRQATELNEELWKMRSEKDVTLKTVSATCPDCGKRNPFNIPSNYNSIKDTGVTWFQCSFCFERVDSGRWLEGGDTNDQ